MKYESLTTDVLPKAKRKTRSDKGIPQATSRQKKFAKNYLRARGNQTLAYRMTYKGVSAETASVNSSRLMAKEHIRTEIEKLLDKQGMPRDYFLKKMKDLAEAVDKNGVPIANVQWDVVKTGLEFHGIIKKHEFPASFTQVNYNLDSDKLNGVLSKLSEVTRKLELSKGQVQDAEIVPEQVVEEDSGKQECGGVYVQQGGLEAHDSPEEVRGN